MNIDIEIKENPEFNSRDIAIFIDGYKAITADQYPYDSDGPYTATSWIVNPQKTKLYHLKQLAEFYDRLKKGNFEQRYDREISVLIMFHEHAGKTLKEIVRLENILQFPEILSLYDFSFLRFNTPYANFGLEPKLKPSTDIITIDNKVTLLGDGTLHKDLIVDTKVHHNIEPQIWTPKNGLLGVVTHQDISNPLSKLFKSTTPYSIPEKEIEPFLRKLYDY